MRGKRTLTMSIKEIKRCEILKMAEEKKITQGEGAKQIRVSERHFRRLLHKHRKKGAEGIISGHRGRESSNRIPREKREKILNKLITEYEGFGSTLASEKLLKRDGIKVSKEKVRQIMIAEGLHKPKARKKNKVHPLRERRLRRGELVQIDGSYHAWLEDRAEKACLLLFIDDATSEILAAEFVEHESYWTYSRLCKRYFRQYGLPEAFYADRFSVFRVNLTNVITTDAQTMFERAIKELGIELICAFSPQAKGRVECANQTLQDRLVKEMRLAGINDYQSANAFLAGYIQIYNAMFAVQPASPVDSHEPLRPENNLDLIFTKRETQKLSKDLQFQSGQCYTYNSVEQISDTPFTYQFKIRSMNFFGIVPTFILLSSETLRTKTGGSTFDLLSLLSSAIIGVIIGVLTNYFADILSKSRHLKKQICPQCQQSFGIKEYIASFRGVYCSKKKLTRHIIVLIVSTTISTLLRIFPYANLGFYESLPILIFIGVILVIDFEHRLILIETSLFGTVLFLIYGIKMRGVLTTALGALAGLLFMLVFYLSGITFSKIIGKLRHQEISEVAFGFGDVIVSTYLGLFAGWPIIIGAIIIAMALFGSFAFFYIIVLLITKRYHAFTYTIPFSPFLIVGVIAIFYLN